jgi:hypothetical protein
MKRRSLAYLLEFSKEDIEANREGYMTKEQRRFHRANGREIAGLKGVGFGFLVAALLTTGIKYDSELIRALVGLGSIILWIVIAIVFAHIQYAPYKHDLYKSKVECVKGRIRLRKESRGRETIRWATIQDESFEIPKELFDAFDNGDTYAIYYAEYSRTILSAERIQLDLPETLLA